MMTCHFYQRNYRWNSVGKIFGKLWTLFIMSITKGITDGQFRRYFSESSRTVHFPIAMLIVVLYRQNHRRIEKWSVYKGNHRRNFPSVFFRELQNCSLSNCNVNCCSLRTKSPTDWKVVGVIWRFSEKIQLI